MSEQQGKIGIIYIKILHFSVSYTTQKNLLGNYFHRKELNPVDQLMNKQSLLYG